MTRFNTKSFNFFTLDQENSKHLYFLRELLKDEKVSAYLKDIDTFLLKDTNELLNNAYLVGLNDNIVGYLNLFDYAKCVEMHYAVLNNYRGIRDNLGDTIGCRIVKESAESIFTSYKRIEYIRLYIDEENIESISLAKRAGFTLNNKYLTDYEYRKYR